LRHPTLLRCTLHDISTSDTLIYASPSNELYRTRRTFEAASGRDPSSASKYDRFEELTRQIERGNKDENPDAVRILLRSDNKAEAIELYHDRTGVSWQEAKEAVDRMERDIE
jgi:hypothetical protein